MSARVAPPSMLDVTEASARILADLAPLSAERVPLADALGRVLARDVVSPVDVPPWRNAGMDGYAVRAADVAAATPAAPVALPVRETVTAGGFPSGPLGGDVAVRVMTGAPLPDGADTVIRVEDTDGGTVRVAIRDARDTGKNVRARGEDVRAGTVAAAAGQLVSPARIGVLASVGAAWVDVHRPPRVAVLATGDELVELHDVADVMAGRRIVTSNSYALAAAVRAAGGSPVSLGLARDDPASIRARLAGVDGCDLLLTSAGVSVGAHDHVRGVLESLGAELRFWRVRIRPGAPLAFGVLRPTAAGRPIPWLGLPGNPVSTLVTFELFARPVIRRLLGHTLLFRRPVPVVAAEPIVLQAPLTHFFRATVHDDATGVRVARLAGSQSSAALSTLAAADALLVVPADRPRVGAGEPLTALMLRDDGEHVAQLAV